MVVVRLGLLEFPQEESEFLYSFLSPSWFRFPIGIFVHHEYVHTYNTGSLAARSRSIEHPLQGQLGSRLVHIETPT